MAVNVPARIENYKTKPTLRRVIGSKQHRDEATVPGQLRVRLRTTAPRRGRPSRCGPTGLGPPGSCPLGRRSSDAPTPRPAPPSPARPPPWPPVPGPPRGSGTAWRPPRTTGDGSHLWRCRFYGFSDKTRQAQPSTVTLDRFRRRGSDRAWANCGFGATCGPLKLFITALQT